MYVSLNQQCNITNRANLLSQWRCSNGKGNLRNVSIIAIEKRDIEFIQRFRESWDKYSHLSQIRQAIMDASTNTMSAILQNNTNVFEKVKMFMAVYEGKPCGFLVANIPKTLPVTMGITYSTRHNCAKNETEIDWLVTWNPNKNENLKGVGKALVGEYFRTVKGDKFRDVFVRSEIPENSNAVYFYESMGFERLGTKRTKLATKNSAQCIAEDFSNPQDCVIPMIVTRSKLVQKAKELSENMSRREFVKNSTDINEIVEG